jgi:fucose 4-O-acetylase-like acetyltransferase
MERNRHADLLRVAAIGAVVCGHWLLIDVTYGRGQLSGLDALSYVRWGEWLTLLFQVMPVFFLVGGYANALSWTSHHEQGESRTRWVRDRAMRLLWPTGVYVIVAVLAITAARLAAVSLAEIAEAVSLVALRLWFLPVYLLLVALTPVMLAAHRRWGLAVPAVMAAAAALVDVGVIGLHLHLIGYANYLLVWGAMHQWGFAWQDGTLTGQRWRPAAMAAGGAALLAGLLTWGPFPVDMIGVGEHVGNTTPPSVALLAFAASQAGLLLALEPVVSRLLVRPRLWRHVKNLNATVMAVSVAYGPGDRHRGGVLPDGSDAAACYRDGAVVGTAARLARPSHGGARAARHGGHAGGTADAPAARRARASGVLVARAPAAWHRGVHGRPGQARDRGIRPGRAPAGACPGGLRRRPARDIVHRPRPARSRPAASTPP